jgi:S-adenosylmethionine:tRNA ribosyltransferase-isomerase
MPLDLRLSSYSYDLPSELIAQTPIEPRDAARLLVLDRSSGAVQHRHVRDLPLLLTPGDLIVANRSRVLPSRLIGRKLPSGGRVELLLLRPLAQHIWEALVGGRRVASGQEVSIGPGVAIQLGDATAAGRAVRFPLDSDPVDLLHRFGHAPLPPYIHGYTGDLERYQTVYASEEGSAAAPTAGLHFTPELLGRLREAGIGWSTVVLHVGLDTFRPMADEDVERHHIHSEWIEVTEEVVDAIHETKQRGRRVVAVGTTTVRALEHAVHNGRLRAYRGAADLFITPGFQFQVVDTLMTNFHMPRSSLLLLVSAYAGRERILAAYEEAIRLRYRLLSFGDAMLIL